MRPESSSARMSRSESRVTYPIVAVPPPARSNHDPRSASEPAEADAWARGCTAGGGEGARGGVGEGTRSDGWARGREGGQAISQAAAEEAIKQATRPNKITS